jgi:hypothetical protein
VSDINGEPFLGAVVSVKGTRIYSSTEYDGNYFIEAPFNDALEFSSLGCETIEVIAGAQSVINISMKTDSSYKDIIIGRGRDNELKTYRGINYGTYGFKFDSHRSLLPPSYHFDVGYDADFLTNSNFNFGIGKTISFSDYTAITVRVKMETANFDNLQYHSYKAIVSREFGIKSAVQPQELSLLSGFMNYDVTIENDNFGIGIGMVRKMGRFTLSPSYSQGT